MKILKCPNDPNHSVFLCSALERVTWKVDRAKNWLGSGPCYDAEIAEGAEFECAECGGFADEVEVEDED